MSSGQPEFVQFPRLRPRKPEQEHLHSHAGISTERDEPLRTSEVQSSSSADISAPSLENRERNRKTEHAKEGGEILVPKLLLQRNSRGEEQNACVPLLCPEQGRNEKSKALAYPCRSFCSEDAALGAFTEIPYLPREVLLPRSHLVVGKGLRERPLGAEYRLHVRVHPMNAPHQFLRLPHPKKNPRQNPARDA
jgi:hypothetical protein